jgi:hypothetical protein
VNKPGHVRQVSSASVRRARIEVCAVALITAVSLILGAPAPVSFALTFCCAATPLVLWAAGGSQLVRAVLLSRPSTDTSRRDGSPER